MPVNRKKVEELKDAAKELSQRCEQEEVEYLMCVGDAVYSWGSSQWRLQVIICNLQKEAEWLIARGEETGQPEPGVAALLLAIKSLSAVLPPQNQWHNVFEKYEPPIISEEEEARVKRLFQGPDASG